jgi:hypothetical protein
MIRYQEITEYSWPELRPVVPVSSLITSYAPGGER